MSLRLLKEHLPWFAPTAAILLAAAGVIDFSPNDKSDIADSAVNEFEAMEVSRNATQNPIAIGQQSAGLAPVISGGATALPAAVVQPQTIPQPQTLQPAVVAPGSAQWLDLVVHKINALHPAETNVRDDTEAHTRIRPACIASNWRAWRSH